MIIFIFQIFFLPSSVYLFIKFVFFFYQYEQPIDLMNILTTFIVSSQFIFTAEAFLSGIEAKNSDS